MSPMETTHYIIDEKSQIFYGFVNCKDQSIEDALRVRKIRPDQLELAFYQNLLDNFWFPH